MLPADMKMGVSMRGSRCRRWG